MAFSTKLLRMQLELFKPFVNGCTLEVARSGQDKLGQLMARTHQSEVEYEEVVFHCFSGEWIRPRQRRRRGVILYLHGGGYVAGDISYARGYGTILCAKNGMDVFCAAYRLAPEAPYPAALEDAQQAYQYLLDSGYMPQEILLCGESAGGGLIYALALQLRDQEKPLPACLIAISPWVDLTLSGKSYEENRQRDPSLTKERLAFFVRQYLREGETAENPLVSPLFADLVGMPSSLIFVGSDEILLDDARRLAHKLSEAGCRVQLQVREDMWHAYLLYGVREARQDDEQIQAFIEEVL